MQADEVTQLLLSENAMWEYDGVFHVLGSSKSGFYGHAGRKGKRGGSIARGNVVAATLFAYDLPTDPFQKPWEHESSSLLAKEYGVSSQHAYSMVAAWSSATSEDYMVALMQEDAAKVFGKEVPRYVTDVKAGFEVQSEELKDRGLPHRAAAAIDEYGTTSEERQEILKAMHQATQKEFLQAGLSPSDHITLYRGLTGTEKFDPTTYPRNPLESWSLDKASAVLYSKSTAGWEDRDFGAVLSTTIPVSDIVSFYRTGMGVPMLEEFVISSTASVSVEETRGLTEPLALMSPTISSILSESPTINSFISRLMEDGYRFRTNGQQVVVLGSSKSGFYGHAGRKGKRGGSAPRGVAFGSTIRYSGLTIQDGPSVSSGDSTLDDMRNQMIQQQENVRKEIEEAIEDAERLEGEYAKLMDYSTKAWDLAEKAEKGEITLKPGVTSDILMQKAIEAEAKAGTVMQEAVEARDWARYQQTNMRNIGKGPIYTPDGEPSRVEPNMTSTIESGKVSESVRSGFDAFHLMVDHRDSLVGEDTVQVRASRGHRPYQQGDSIYINKNTVGECAVVHELGHWLESNDPQARQAVRGFMAQRTTNERLVKMSSYGQGYDPSEVTKPDKFLHPYVGKQYPFGASEALSMGMEMMLSDPVMFARRDPQHFDLTFNIMKNRYDSPFMQDLLSAGEIPKQSTHVAHW